MNGAHTQPGAGGGTETSEQAKQEAQHTKDEASRQARATADTAKDEARQVVDEARSQARNVVQEAKQVGRTRADEQAERLAGAMHQLHEQANALLDGRPDEAGPVGDYARQFSDAVGRYADRVDELGFEGILRETSRFARRRPGAFLLAAAGAGLLAGRMGRGASDAQNNASSKPALPADTSGVSRGSTGSTAVGAGASTGAGTAPPPVVPVDEPTVDDSPDQVRGIREDTFDAPVAPPPPSGANTRHRDPATPMTDEGLDRDTGITDHRRSI